MPRPIWTAEQARQAGIKSAQLRAQRKAYAIANPQPIQPNEEQVSSATLIYSDRRLARVRKQLDRIDEMMLAETDPQKLDRLASAQARLAEQERILSGRPLPGSLKPSSRQARRAPGPSSPDLPQT